MHGLYYTAGQRLIVIRVIFQDTYILWLLQAARNCSSAFTHADARLRLRGHAAGSARHARGIGRAKGRGGQGAGRFLGRRPVSVVLGIHVRRQASRLRSGAACARSAVVAVGRTDAELVPSSYQQTVL